MTRETVDELARELRARGVPESDARRVCAEARAHLDDTAARIGEDAAVAAFGSVGEIAARVAAELAVTRTRTAALRSFAALSLLAAAYVAVTSLEGAAGSPPDIADGRNGVVGIVATAGAALLPQFAFVAGSLALLQALRLRKRDAGGRELALLRRRAAIALVFGGGTTLALALRAYEFGPLLAGWWAPTALALCAAGVLALVPAVRSVVGSTVPAPRGCGESWDVFDDFAPVFRLDPVARLGLPRHPWRFAGLCALGVGAIGFAGGMMGEGVGDGLFFGTVEAVSLLAGFALLGTTLGLRRVA